MACSSCQKAKERAEAQARERQAAAEKPLGYTPDRIKSMQEAEPPAKGEEE